MSIQLRDAIVSEDTAASALPTHAPNFRTGYVAVVGRPNVGKSTLVNALVGQKVSITADKAQTTRHRIHGILTTQDAQFIFVDTPGYQTRHGNALNRAMNRAVTTTLADVDCVLFVVEAHRWTPADRKVLERIPQETPTILAISKTDLAGPRESLLPFVAKVAEARAFAAVVPLSSTRKHGLDALLAEARQHLPQQAPMFSADDFTDRSARFIASEIVREKLFRLVGDEVPYHSTVEIERYEEEGRLHRINAAIVVDAASQKAIVIGAGGERIKRIASEARVELERLLDAKVFLEVWVKTRSGWADNEAAVKAAGYE
ncbi:MAG TPA: GTPase Era [Burkholderiaceae bacterium]|nr:GTPase Era [Burkholderiaceae bacterium]